MGVPLDSLMIGKDKMGVAGSFCAPTDNGLANSEVLANIRRLKTIVAKKVNTVLSWTLTCLVELNMLIILIP